jgi:hypothetical protein
MRRKQKLKLPLPMIAVGMIFAALITLLVVRWLVFQLFQMAALVGEAAALNA